jgi:hypothetical protein
VLISPVLKQQIQLSMQSHRAYGQNERGARYPAA